MGLTDFFNQWIVERGSAVVQEKHIALFKDQLVIADKKISSLESENTVLKAENADLKSKSNQLVNEITILKKKIYAYENPIQHETIPPAPQINIMKLLYLHDTLATERIAELFDLKLQEAKYHLDDLKAVGLIKTKTVYHDVEKKLPFGTQYSQHGVLSWTLEQKGRKFLIDNKLT